MIKTDQNIISPQSRSDYRPYGVFFSPDIFCRRWSAVTAI